MIKAVCMDSGLTLIPHCIKNAENGRLRSSKKSNSLWSMSFGRIKLQGPEQASCSCCELVKGIKLSSWPWMKKLGHVTLGISSKLLNLSFTRKVAHEPAIVLTTERIEVYADMSSMAPGFILAASQAAGPEPIERPKTRTLRELNFICSTRYRIMSSESWMTCSASESPVYKP